MSQSIVLEKAFAFALRIVKLYQYLGDEKREYIIGKQLLIAGTHIGKHIKEAVAAESKQVFTNEMRSLYENLPKPNTGWSCFFKPIFYPKKCLVKSTMTARNFLKC